MGLDIMQPTNKFIEGIADECFRQGLTEKQASIVLEYALYRAQGLTKQAAPDSYNRTFIGRMYDKMLDWFGGNSDPGAQWESEHPGHSVETRFSRMGKYQNMWRDAYNDAVRQAYYDETGAPRKTPLYNGDTKAIQQAAYKRMLTNMDGGRSLGIIREADEALAKLTKEMELAKRTGNTGVWRDLNEQRQEWLKRQTAAREKANAINEEALREITGVGSYSASDNELRESIKQRYRMLKADYDDAQRVKWWNPFSWTAAIGAPSKEELEEAKSRAQAVFQADKAREMAKNFEGLNAVKDEAAIWKQEHNAVAGNPAAVDNSPNREKRMTNTTKVLNDKAQQHQRQLDEAAKQREELEQLRERTRRASGAAPAPATPAGGTPAAGGTDKDYDIVRVPEGVTKVPSDWEPHTSGTAYNVERRTYKVPKQQ
jgi:hypothetical protein